MSVVKEQYKKGKFISLVPTWEKKSYTCTMEPRYKILIYLTPLQQDSTVSGISIYQDICTWNFHYTVEPRYKEVGYNKNPL